MPRARSHKPRNHGENQYLVCLVCYQKGSDMRKIVGVTLQRIHKHFFEDFDSSDFKLPNGTCSRCRKLLERVDNWSKDTSALPNPTDFSSLLFPTTTRSSGFTTHEDVVGCTCSICTVANTESNVKPFPKGRPPTWRTKQDSLLFTCKEV